ncbi:NPR1/NH1-interacting protein [Sesbania bispinosa]|nr:NPR1/NH1-interacting protein [Sesbania bispinosa]
MESNSASKKRKFCSEEDGAEQDEEAKMETFFALVRSMRETRNRWINFRSGDSSNKKKISKNDITGDIEENRSVTIATWKPTFQLEDFAEEEANKKCGKPEYPALASDQSNSCAAAKKDDADKGIDLRLSL